MLNNWLGDPSAFNIIFDITKLNYICVIGTHIHTYFTLNLSNKLEDDQ